jgi:hypothetical protein
MSNEILMNNWRELNDKVIRLEAELKAARAMRHGLACTLRRDGSLKGNEPVMNTSVAQVMAGPVAPKARLSPAEQKARDDAYWASMQAEGTVPAIDDLAEDGPPDDGDDL